MGQNTSLLLSAAVGASAVVLVLNARSSQKLSYRSLWLFKAVFLIKGILALRKYMHGISYHGEERIPGKTVIITGGNSGIGMETARVLAERGARVILACRDMSRCQAAQKELIHETGSTNIVCKKLDLASLTSIRAFANDINETESRLDILINNAGIMMCPKQLTEDGFEMQFGVNHLGHFLLTNLLLDKLKASAPSRIIIVSSRAHLSGAINFDDINSAKSYNRHAAYAQSKLANLLHVRELAKQLTGSKVTVNGLHPGLVDTGLIRHVKILRLMLAPLIPILIKTPLEGAQTTLRLALDPSLETVSGRYFSECAERQTGPKALDDEAARKLWLVSEELIGGQ